MKDMILIAPLAPAVVFGLLNWLYWRRKGYTSPTQLILGIMVFYGVFYGIFRFLYA